MTLQQHKFILAFHGPTTSKCTYYLDFHLFFLISSSPNLYLNNTNDLFEVKRKLKNINKRKFRIKI